MHVDEFIDRHTSDAASKYARWVLSLMRLSAVLQADFAKWTKPYKLYCTYETKRYRVTGASRFGDVWLHEDLVNEHQSEGGTRDAFYQHRVDVDQCSNWGPEP